MLDEIIKSMFSTSEINRLHRCAKNKDKKEIIKWGQEFESRLSELYRKRYREHYLKEYEERLKDLDTALLYTLHFGETTRFGNKRLKSIMEDISTVISEIHLGQFSNDDLREELIKDGIKIKRDFKQENVFKKKEVK